jgi:hypothetical protein
VAVVIVACARGGLVRGGGPAGVAVLDLLAGLSPALLAEAFCGMFKVKLPGGDR